MFLEESFKHNRNDGIKPLWSKQIMVVIYITIIIMQALTIACARERHFNNPANETMSIMTRRPDQKVTKVQNHTPSKIITPFSLNSPSLLKSKQKGTNAKSQKKAKSPSESKKKGNKASKIKQGKSTSSMKQKGKKAGKQKNGKASKSKGGKSKSLLCQNPIITETEKLIAEMPTCPNVGMLQDEIVKRLEKSYRHEPCKKKVNFDCYATCLETSRAKRSVRNLQDNIVMVYIEIYASSPYSLPKFEEEALSATVEVIDEICGDTAECPVYPVDRTPTPTPSPTNLVPVSTLSPSPTPTPTTLSPSPTPTTLSPSPTATTLSPSPTPTTLSPSPTPTTLYPSPTPTTLSPSPTPTTPSPLAPPIVPAKPFIMTPPFVVPVIPAKPYIMTPFLVVPSSPFAPISPIFPSPKPPTISSPSPTPTTLSPLPTPTTLSPSPTPTTPSPLALPIVPTKPFIMTPPFVVPVTPAKPHIMTPFLVVPSSPFAPISPIFPSPKPVIPVPQPPMPFAPTPMVLPLQPPILIAPAPRPPFTPMLTTPISSQTNPP